MQKCKASALDPHDSLVFYGPRRYWLAIVDAIAADVQGEGHLESMPATARPSSAEDALVSALCALSLNQLIMGMDDPDLFPSALSDVMLHPVDFAFLKTMQELMAGAATHETHDMLLWCSEYSGDCVFILSTLLTVGDSRMGLERDILRASTLLQECSSKANHALCKLAWSSRSQNSRDSNERSASEKNMNDLDALIQVLCHLNPCIASY